MSTGSSIGGNLRYDLLADLNQPTDPESLRAEVRRLAGTGLTAGDISTALRLSLPAIREMLAATATEASAACAERWSARP